MNPSLVQIEAIRTKLDALGKAVDTAKLTLDALVERTALDLPADQLESLAKCFTAVLAGGEPDLTSREWAAIKDLPESSWEAFSRVAIDMVRRSA